MVIDDERSEAVGPDRPVSGDHSFASATVLPFRSD
jgi:hypothetical protein